MMRFRYLFVAALLTAVVFGISGMMASQPAGSFGGFPLPPPPVLCGCLCEDGSFIIVHAPTANDCPKACAAACSTGS